MVVIILTEQPAEVTFLPVNATAVRMTWSGSVHLPTTVHYTSSLSNTGTIMNQYERIYPPGTTSDVLVLDDDDVTLADEYVHNFSLHYIIRNDVPGPSTITQFTFGTQILKCNS